MGQGEDKVAGSLNFLDVKRGGDLELIFTCIHMVIILAIDFPGGKCNHNIKITAQLRILMCIAMLKEASQKVLKHVYSCFVAACNIFRV